MYIIHSHYIRVGEKTSSRRTCQHECQMSDVAQFDTLTTNSNHTKPYCELFHQTIHKHATHKTNRYNNREPKYNTPAQHGYKTQHSTVTALTPSNKHRSKWV